MKVDLHCHTNCSDGSLTPNELIDCACSEKIDLLAITDHDNIDAYLQASDYRNDEIRLITGIEFSTSWRKIGIHVVGLNMDANNQALIKGIEFQRQARLERAEKIIQKLNKKFGFTLSLDEIKKEADSENIGRPHIARTLHKHGIVNDHQQAFSRYLGAGKAGDVKEHWADLEQVIQWIRDSGGNAVLAHPLKYKMTRTKLIECLNEFKRLGGQGIEVCSGLQESSQTKMITKLGLDLELYASCGSDFHRPNMSWSGLGQFSALPDECQPIWQLWGESFHKIQ